MPARHEEFSVRTRQQIQNTRRYVDINLRYYQHAFTGFSRLNILFHSEAGVAVSRPPTVHCSALGGDKLARGI